MNDFWKSSTYRIVQAMKATGNRVGVIADWKYRMERWAQFNSGPDAEAVKAFLPLWQVRSAYTAAELAPIFPAIALMFGFSRRLEPQKSPGRLANELTYAGLPHFEKGDVKYFVVECCHRAKEIENAFS